MRLPITLPCPGSRRFVVQGPIALSTQLPFRTLDCESCRAEGCIARVEKHEPSSCNGSRCIPRIIRQITRWPLPESDAMFDPSDGWFLPELARNSFCQSLFDPSDGWFCRTCSKFVPPNPCLILPTGGFCPNLLEIRSAKSLFDPSDGWFLPELARNSVCQVPSDPDQFPTENSGSSGTRGPRPTRMRQPASGFVFPEITAAIECEMILWSGKEHCAAGVRAQAPERGG